MNREQILDTIKSLSTSQGSYSRLYAQLCEMRDNEPDRYNKIMETLESEHFKDAVDLVLFLEG